MPTNEFCKKKNTEAALNPEGLPEEVRVSMEGLPEGEQATLLGLGNVETSNWDVPALVLASNEELIRRGNAAIRLGKDRESHLFSGFGGKPGSHNAAIDIVAGNMGWCARLDLERPVNPDFKMDAARIYISQKSNVDGYFELSPGNVGNTSMKDPRSTVAVKADTVRIIGRENIKLVTRTDDYNSQGGQVGKNTYVKGYGIDLIAFNEKGQQQPLVKGNYLVEALDGMVGCMEVIVTLLQNYFNYSAKFQKAVQAHTHISPFFGSETPPDFAKLITQGIEGAISTALNVDVPLMMDYPIDIATVKNNYLVGEGGIPGPKYILSKYNTTN